MQKVADERADEVDTKLAKLTAAQRQIGDQIGEQAAGRVRSEISGALVDDTAGLVTALAVNANVAVMPIVASRYLLPSFFFI